MCSHLLATALCKPNPRRYSQSNLKLSKIAPSSVPANFKGAGPKKFVPTFSRVYYMYKPGRRVSQSVNQSTDLSIDRSVFKPGRRSWLRLVAVVECRRQWKFLPSTSICVERSSIPRAPSRTIASATITKTWYYSAEHWHVVYVEHLAEPSRPQPSPKRDIIQQNIDT